MYQTNDAVNLRTAVEEMKGNLTTGVVVGQGKIRPKTPCIPV